MVCSGVPHPVDFLKMTVVNPYRAEPWIYPVFKNPCFFHFAYKNMLKTGKLCLFSNPDTLYTMLFEMYEINTV